MELKLRPARIIWPPYPHRAGFCITDDTDVASLDEVRTVYDFLMAIGLRATKTVWVHEATELCGIPGLPSSTLRGVTLEDEDYLSYCRDLHENGFEIALHGASAGNNTRENTAAAFEFMEAHFGGSETFICHSKNAENPYWEELTAPNRPLELLLKTYTRHKAWGHVPTSPYFWGDICLKHVKQIRLFRTRRPNTLSVNPSMPYFRAETPYVNSWFGATKRRFADCTTSDELKRLETENGLCVLYQYMHRYADPDLGGGVDDFKKSAERLMGESRIWVDTTAVIMDRLRQIQSVFVLYRDRKSWLINAGDNDAADIQILLPPGVRFLLSGNGAQDGSTLVVKRLAAGSITELSFDSQVRWQGDRTQKLTKQGRSTLGFGHGELHVNLSDQTIKTPSNTDLAPSSFALSFKEGQRERRPFSKASQRELMTLFSHQTQIIGREFLLKGRRFNQNKFLGDGEIRLENYESW